MKKVLFFVLAALCMVACGEQGNGNGGDGSITSAEMSKSSLEMIEGQEYRLTVRVQPEDAEFTAEWSSSNELVVSVSENGTLYAGSSGEAVITAKLVGTDIEVTCNVVVKSMLDATVFDLAGIFGAGTDNPYDVKMQFSDGGDTICRAITARYLILPSTMYIDGEGYLAGDGGFVFNMETSFLIDEAAGSWICLANYQFTDNILNEEGKRRPWRVQVSSFDESVYTDYMTQVILYSNGRVDVKPESADYPYYKENDSYFLRAYPSEQGISLVDGGYITLGGEENPGIIQIHFHPQDERKQAPVYYDFNATLFTNTNNLGLAIEEKVDEETGETIYVFVDKDEDGKFDMAPTVEHHFANGAPVEAPAQENNYTRAQIEAAHSIPAAVGIKNIEINRTLHVALRQAINLK